MAIKLASKPNVVAPGGAYPYGNIRDRAGSTAGTPVNTVVYADFHQFFARIAANAGIPLNDLAENSTNGFQYVQALNKLINQELSALAGMMGAIGFTAVNMSGMGSTTVGPTTTVAPGWFFYDGQYVYFLGGTHPLVGAGDAVYIVIGTTDGLPTATLTVIPDTTPDDATQFQLNRMIAYGTGVFNQWQDGGTLTFGVVGGPGSVTVLPGDIKYNRYKIIGKTLYYQLRVESFNVTGTVTGISVVVPFITSAWANGGMYYCGSYQVVPALSVFLHPTLPGEIHLTNATGGTINPFDVGGNSIFFDIVTELP